MDGSAEGGTSLTTPIVRIRTIGLVLMLGCAGDARSGLPEAPEKPIALPPLVSLVPGAGLEVLVDVRPREVLRHPEMGPLLAMAVPDEQFRTFAGRHGGVDVRELEEVVVTTYGAATLALALGAFSRPALERAFADRTLQVSSRTIDQAGGPLSSILRLEGGQSEPATMVLFGSRAVGVETGATAHPGRELRIAELFATKRLLRSKPALDAPPLDAAATAFPTAPIRLFFPGPFEGKAAKGLAGLLQAATAVVVAAQVASDAAVPALDIVVGLLGAWNEDAEAAGQRFAAAVENMTREDIARLCGLHAPLRGPELKVSRTMLTVSARVDAKKLAAGARAATGGQIDEIMR